MHGLDHLGAGQAEVLVAALELGPAEVLRRQLLPLEVGAGGAVEHEDALPQELLELATAFVDGDAVRRGGKAQS